MAFGDKTRGEHEYDVEDEHGVDQRRERQRPQAPPLTPRGDGAHDFTTSRLIASAVMPAAAEKSRDRRAMSAISAAKPTVAGLPAALHAGSAAPRPATHRAMPPAPGRTGAGTEQRPCRAGLAMAARTSGDPAFRTVTAVWISGARPDTLNTQDQRLELLFHNDAGSPVPRKAAGRRRPAPAQWACPAPPVTTTSNGTPPVSTRCNTSRLSASITTTAPAAGSETSTIGPAVATRGRVTPRSIA